MDKLTILIALIPGLFVLLLTIAMPVWFLLTILGLGI